tara:strand:+ start:2046 stop:2777 length:732 start_codon:yes stop_codon:yes gene_type:complete
MNILITGSKGFIGKNLIRYFENNTNHNIYSFSRKDNLNKIENLIEKIDIVFHFAGVNKSKEKDNFKKVNINLTKKICSIISRNPNIILFYASSTQANLENHYGISKRNGEEICMKLQNQFRNKVYILRLPGIFGIGCKPNYNSVVATFCYNSANKIPLKIINPEKEIDLLFIDDLCAQLNKIINQKPSCKFIELKNIHKISIKKLAFTIKNFHQNLNNLKFSRSDDLLESKLFKTYKSYFIKK